MERSLDPLLAKVLPHLPDRGTVSPQPERLGDDWSFFGVRKGNAMRKDAVTIRPHQVILVGVALAAVFVATLLLVVRLILKSAGV